MPSERAGLITKDRGRPFNNRVLFLGILERSSAFPTEQLLGEYTTEIVYRLTRGNTFMCLQILNAPSFRTHVVGPKNKPMLGGMLITEHVFLFLLAAHKIWWLAAKSLKSSFGASARH